MHSGPLSLAHRFVSTLFFSPSASPLMHLSPPPRETFLSSGVWDAFLAEPLIAFGTFCTWS